MSNFLVSYNNLRGESVTSEWFNSFNELQLFMNSLIGRTFSATVQKFVSNKLVGSINYKIDTENDLWIKK